MNNNDEDFNQASEGIRSDEITKVNGKTMIEHVGGPVKVRELAKRFHERVLEDPILRGLFLKSGKSTHARHLAHFLEEIMGGEKKYTSLHDGVRGLFEAHRNLDITEEQRKRFVEIFVETLDLVHMPEDARFRRGFEARIEQGSHFSKDLSQRDVISPSQWPQVGTWDW